MRVQSPKVPLESAGFFCKGVSAESSWYLAVCAQLFTIKCDGTAGFHARITSRSGVLTHRLAMTSRESISSATKPLPPTWFQESEPSNQSQWTDQNITPGGLPTMTHIQFRPSNTSNCSIEFMLSNLLLLDCFQKSMSEGNYLLATPWQESASISPCLPRWMLNCPQDLTSRSCTSAQVAWGGKCCNVSSSSILGGRVLNWSPKLASCLGEMNQVVAYRVADCIDLGQMKSCERGEILDTMDPVSQSKNGGTYLHMFRGGWQTCCYYWSCLLIYINWTVQNVVVTSSTQSPCCTRYVLHELEGKITSN
jgi:hypothetical protein